jgi:hypothetical protein
MLSSTKIGKPPAALGIRLNTKSTAKSTEHGGHGGVGGRQVAELLAETQATEPRSHKASNRTANTKRNTEGASRELPASSMKKRHSAFGNRQSAVGNTKTLPAASYQLPAKSTARQQQTQPATHETDCTDSTMTRIKRTPSELGLPLNPGA